MSDELRDLMQNRADAIEVPSGDVAGVVAGGRGIKARRYALAGAASVVVIALIAWGATDGTRTDRDRGQIADPGPTETESPEPTPTAGLVAGACERIPFRPGSLPEGWDYVLGEGSGGERGVPPEERAWPALGHWAEGAADSGTFIDVYEYDSAPYPNVTNPEAIRVLGVDAVIGDIHDGYGVTFTYEGCRWVLNGFGLSRKALRAVAERLQPRGDCKGRDTRAFDPLPDGRHFGDITAINGVALDFEEAEFLTGEAADEAAREDGAMEAVELDYYIDDDSTSVRGMGVDRSVEVLLETTPRDGSVGLARWSYPDLVCMFGSDNPIDVSNMQFPFWITVEDGVVTRIEQQYLP